MNQSSSPRVGLFVTCLVNLFRPSVGFASIKLLEQAGCTVVVPEHQTCCGQPGYNPGDFVNTRKVAKQVITTFADFDYVVAPSGSCAGMLRVHYPDLLKEDQTWSSRAQDLATKTFELTSFLTDVMHFAPVTSHDLSNKSITYHDACAGLRELGIKQQPRKLLRQCANTSVTEMEKTEVCCGFGGTFCAKMPTVSEALVSDKLHYAMATQAKLLLAGDLGCLFNIAGRAKRLNKKLEIRHVAEVLANTLDQPGIGEGQSE